jgi:hypothetical protein
VNAVDGTLYCHAGHEHHSRDNRWCGVAIGKRAEPDGENTAGEQQYQL